MPYAEREFSCSGCGRVIWRRAPESARPRCVECGIQQSTDQMTQMHRRNGPWYEQWLLANIEAFQRRLIAYRARQAAGDVAKALRRGQDGGTPTPLKPF